MFFTGGLDNITNFTKHFRFVASSLIRKNLQSARLTVNGGY